MSKTKSAAPAILVSESTPGARLAWRQYAVITNGRVAIVEMLPALGGWKFHRVTIQGDNEWSGMTADQIVAWKLANSCSQKSTIAPDLGTFTSTLLEVAASGRLPEVK